jgi:hypothetical protein
VEAGEWKKFNSLSKPPRKSSDTVDRAICQQTGQECIGLSTEPLQGECRAALRVPCRTKLRLEHVSTGRLLPAKGVDISISGMRIRVSDEDAKDFKIKDGLHLRIDPEEEDYFEALDSLHLAAQIVRIWPSEEQEGFTNIAVEFVHRLIPQPTPDDSENLHK